MSSIPIEHFLILGAILFCLGMIAIITKRHAIVVLMGIELIFNAANLNLIAFSRADHFEIQGQMFALFVILIAAAEAAIALAIILRVYKLFNTVSLDQVNNLNG